MSRRKLPIPWLLDRNILHARGLSEPQYGLWRIRMETKLDRQLLDDVKLIEMPTSFEWSDESQSLWSFLRCHVVLFRSHNLGC